MVLTANFSLSIFSRNANIRIFPVITTRKTMYILQYFKHCSKNEVALPELPNPSGSLSKNMPSSSIAAANEAVKAEILDCHQDSKKRGQYIKLTTAHLAQRLEIGRKASEIGIASAIRFYKKKYPDLPLTEPTVRRMKNQYIDELKKRPRTDDFEELPMNKRGRPLNWRGTR